VAYLSVGRDITARKAAERRLVESERRLKLALEAGRQGVWEMDLAAGRIAVDATFEELLGFAASSYTLDLEQSYAAYHPDDQECVRAALAPLLRGEADDFRVEARRAAGDGLWRWVLNFGRVAERDQAGRPLRVVGTTIDISQRREAEEHLRDSEQRLRLALEAGNLGVWESDLSTERVRFDPICLTRLGWAAEPCELSLAEVIARIHPRDRGMVQSAYAQCHRGEPAQTRLEYRVRRRDGAHAWIEEHAMVADRGHDGRPRRLVGVSADITARKVAEMQLAHLALHDPLTGLPNRRALAEALDRAMAGAKRSGRPLAVLALDLDGFKLVNDAHGHPAGDAALVEVAARLRRVVRRADLVARVGGDEFAVVAGELRGTTPVVRLARRIQAALAEPIPLAEGAVRIGVSIGVAFFPGDGATPEQLLRRADAALYAAKRDRIGWRFSAEVAEPVGTG
jgi:diguanylate cyclase (GGDEF)-like protein/PAS domain S-box-containing protein